MITTGVDDVTGTILNDAVRTYHAMLRHALDGLALDAVEAVTREILATYDRGGQIFVFGNGGSAATASHMACDLGKNTVTPGLPRLRIQSLTDNTALLTALANDLGYEAVFAEQLLQAPVWAEDLIIAISGSGNSPNVLAGVATATQAGAHTVGITGFCGGALATTVDVALIVASDCMEIIEDVHLMINHAITTGVRMALRARTAAAPTGSSPRPASPLHGARRSLRGDGVLAARTGDASTPLFTPGAASQRRSQR